MTELTVVSGKGGTGKTSLVGALATLAGTKVLVDCDVDAADLHLILGDKPGSVSEFIGGKRASIDEERCTNCALCVEYCRFGAIAETSPAGGNAVGQIRINPHACDGCGVCVRHCPEQAIDFGDVVSGQWYLSDTRYGPLVHARLGIAQANSGKLVSLLRRQARAMAAKHEADLIVVDGPPGIGCPVIASITGASYVLVVTEPSMSALHDMQRLLQLTAHFGIPTGICINKFDINSDMADRIETSAEEQKAVVLGRIPFDHAVTAAQMAGTTVMDHGQDGIRESVKELWTKLSAELQSKGHSSPIRML